MREVSGTTWSFQMIILFILIFACFLTLVIAYSKAYTIKNEMLTIIEKYEGITEGNDGSLVVINNYLKQNSYKTSGVCPTDTENWFGALDLNGGYEKAQDGKGYLYCFQEIKKKKDYAYNIKVFYRFYLPVLGDIATFTIDGRTNNFRGNENRVTK